MPFRPRWTEEAATRFEKLQAAAPVSAAKRAKDKKAKASNAEGLLKQLAKCVRLPLEDPRHPGLQAHEFRSIRHPYERDGKVLEAYVQNRTPGAYSSSWCH